MENNQQYYEEEIDLYELVMLFWKKKALIIAVTLIFAVVAGGFTKLFISPVYETRLRLMVTLPETITTKYGTYNTVIKTSNELVELINTNDVLQTTIDESEEYKEATVLGLRERIKIESSKDKPNTFVIRISGNSPEDSFQLANTIYENYMRYLNVTLGEMSLSYFQKDFETRIESLTIDLQLQNELLAKTEQLAKEIPLSYMNGEALNNIRGSLDYLMLQNIINPNRVEIDAKIISFINQINILESSVEHMQSQLTMIESDLRKLADGNLEEMVFASDKVYLASEPVLPTQKSSPSTVMNTAIGGILGGMLSVFYVLISEWIKDKQKA